ncbi:MAG: beta-galactosidase [Armatimonadetes bacterium]|nr:beta-galactosidase [Armatimonadota bacterium]
MSGIIPAVGRRSWKVRLGIALMYVILTLGAVTMVYPFLLMIGASVSSEADYSDYRPVPRYLYDVTALFAKEVEIRYSGDMVRINERYGTDWANLQAVVPPQVWPENSAAKAVVQMWNGSVNYFQGQTRGLNPLRLPPVNPHSPEARRQLADWRRFSAALPGRFVVAGYAGRPAAPASAPSRLLDLYRAWLEKRYGTINRLNAAYGEENTSFASVLTPMERETKREWNLDDTRKMREWKVFKAQAPQRFKLVVRVDPIFQEFLSQDQYEDDIHALNKAWGTQYGYFSEIHLPEAMPATPAERADWEKFVRTQLPFRFMRVDASAAPAWRAFLKTRYTGLQQLQIAHQRPYSSFDTVPLPGELPSEGQILTDWMDFIAGPAPIGSLHPDGSENRYRAWLQKKFSSVKALNRAYGLNYNSIAEAVPPFQLEDWSYTLNNSAALRKYFALANFQMVWDYIGRHGRAVFNTFFYVFLAITTHLIVNPLCAYSLSRYNLRYGHRVLLFLLATMAFPAEVAMIPSFLLLKNLNLLNTFAALILPGVASGYSIFLLKGFFDSLPRELYEAGIIDGASEGRMFWQITVPLSKPVLAVIALSSFTVAYGNFMFAFLVCQDPKMWTIMVWLYELQLLSPQYVVMAALAIAAIPTLLIFVFCQNIIMRGIILPSFK